MKTLSNICRKRSNFLISERKNVSKFFGEPREAAAVRRRQLGPMPERGGLIEGCEGEEEEDGCEEERRGRRRIESRCGQGQDGRRRRRGRLGGVEEREEHCEEEGEGDAAEESVSCEAEQMLAGVLFCECQQRAGEGEAADGHEERENY